MSRGDKPPMGDPTQVPQSDDEKVAARAKLYEQVQKHQMEKVYDDLKSIEARRVPGSETPQAPAQASELGTPTMTETETAEALEDARAGLDVAEEVTELGDGDFEQIEKGPEPGEVTQAGDTDAVVGNPEATIIVEEVIPLVNIKPGTERGVVPPAAETQASAPDTGYDPADIEKTVLTLEGGDPDNQFLQDDTEQEALAYGDAPDLAEGGTQAIALSMEGFDSASDAYESYGTELLRLKLDEPSAWKKIISRNARQTWNDKKDRIALLEAGLEQLGIQVAKEGGSTGEIEQRVEEAVNSQVDTLTGTE